MNILLATNPAIFYILAVVCFCAFLVGLMWYIFAIKKNNLNNKQTKSWTIESARKFLESQNVEFNKTQNDDKNTQNVNEMAKAPESKDIKTTKPKNMPVNKTLKTKNDKEEK